MSDQSLIEPSMAIISEPEFAKLCADIFADRQDIYQLNPNVSRSEALLWMLLGCLVSLLSVKEPPDVSAAKSSDPYGDAITQVLRGRCAPEFDPRAHITALARMAEAEA